MVLEPLLDGHPQYFAHAIKRIVETSLPLLLILLEYLPAKKHQRLHDMKSILNLHVDTEFS